MRKKTGKITAGVAAATAGMMAAFAFAAAPASASGVNVDQWRDTCNHAPNGNNGCLYYSQNGGGDIFLATGYISDLTGYVFPNKGQVRNNAASIGSATINCGATTWVSAHATGDFNWVHYGYGGNLGTTLRNNENSFDPDANCV